MADPIDMVLHCPKCGLQHIDAPETEHPLGYSFAVHGGEWPGRWTNPPHKSHLCHGCSCIWRPADVPTNGVAAVQTRGKADTWPPLVCCRKSEPGMCDDCPDGVQGGESDGR